MWLPFILRITPWFGIRIEDPNFLYIYRNFDGLLYVVAAKTLYNPLLIKGLHLEAALEPIYFSAHFPLYPLLIRALAGIFGYLKAMVIVNIASTLLLVFFFYYLISKLKITSHPLILSSVLLFLPRFLVIRSIGAPESLFILFILISLFLFEKEKYLWSAVAGSLAVATRSPGILLIPAYGLVFIERYIKKRSIDYRWLYMILIPLTLLSIFLFYGKQYGDFFAYFNSGDNLHLEYPFAVFNYDARWVGTAWLEDAFFFFFFYLLTLFSFKKSRLRSFYYFVFVYFSAIVLIQHRDISRYSLPLWPFALIAFEKFFTSRKFLVALILLLPAIYMLAWNFMGHNVMPVSDWSAFR